MNNEQLTMKNRKKRGLLLNYLLFTICYLLFISLASCTSMVQKGGEILDGSSSSKTQLSVYRSSSGSKRDTVELNEFIRKDGKWAMEISSKRWPGLVLCGGMSDGSGRSELFEAHILSSHPNGWNEFKLDIMGSAVFANPIKTGGVLYINEENERVQISSGAIRLKSSRLTGDSALTALRNRRERILALTEWMAEQTESISYGGGEKAIYSSKDDFEKHWKPLLFPEMVSKKKKPSGYTKENAEWRRADSVKWNLDYSRNNFPEHLWEYRNSGAMLRDWEEALNWIFMEYSWDFILSSFNDTHLNRIK